MFFLILAALFIMAPPSNPGDAPTSRKQTSQDIPVSITRSLAPPVPQHPRELVAENPAASGAEAGWTQWIHALRKAGVPDEVIADGVTMDFERRWQDRVGAIESQVKRGQADDSALAELHLRRAGEFEREMRSALGEEGFRQWERDRILRPFQMGQTKLSAFEADALYRLKKDLDSLARSIEEARLKGMIDDIDYERQAEAMVDHYDRGLDALLGSRRYALENSFGGENGELRRTLHEINATDAQAEAILQSMHQWRDQRAGLEDRLTAGLSDSPEYEPQIRALDAARDQEFQRVLGAERFAEFQKSQDHRYKAMKRYASAWQLSEQDVEYLYRMQRHYETSVQTYRQQVEAVEERGQPMDQSAVQAGVEQFALQTEQTLRSYLGEERFIQLMRNGIVALDK